MRRLHVSLFIVGIGSLGAMGCGANPDSAPQNLGEVRQHQVDPGFFVASQGGVETMALAHLSDGTEYWVSTPNYSAAGNRTFTGYSGTCSQWQSHVCGSGYANAHYYKATWAHQTLSCANPPSQVQAPQGAISFLGAGTWDDAVSGNNFGVTYVASNVEYWAMNHALHTTDTTTQNKRVNGYSSFTAFINGICANNPPSDWWSAYYTTVNNFCSLQFC